MISLKDLNAIAKTVEGVPVWGVFNGPASRAGVRFGDIIVSCNGVRTKTIDDYFAAMDRDVDGQRNVVVFRDGSEVELAIEVEEEAITVEEAARQIDEGNMVPLNRGRSRNPPD